SVIIRFMSSLVLVSVLIMTGMSGVLSFFMNRWKHPGVFGGNKGDSRTGTAVAYASVWDRFLAKAVDTVLVGLPVGALVWWRTDPAAFLFMGTAAEFFSTGGRAFILVPLALAVYHIVCEGLWGKTPGKHLLRIRVTGKEGEDFGMGRSALRNLFRLLDGLYFYGIGLVSIAATQKWQRVGDFVGRTIVIKDQER
ncbi:MAG TPA: RDD family protein, partial [Nitrospiria bacterium]